MKKATISQTKNQLSALLDRVRHGEVILIVDRNRPVARLEPAFSAGAADSEGRLARLERGGVLRRGTGSRVNELLRQRPPRPARGGDILQALLAEREESR